MTSELRGWPVVKIVSFYCLVRKIVTKVLNGWTMWEMMNREERCLTSSAIAYLQNRYITNIHSTQFVEFRTDRSLIISSVQIQLQYVGFPQSCQDIQRIGFRNNGNYTLYYEKNTNTFFEVFCKNMTKKTPEHQLLLLFPFPNYVFGGVLNSVEIDPWSLVINTCSNRSLTLGYLKSYNKPAAATMDMRGTMFIINRAFLFQMAQVVVLRKSTINYTIYIVRKKKTLSSSSSFSRCYMSWEWCIAAYANKTHGTWLEKTIQVDKSRACC